MWLAIDDAAVENGAMTVIPKSHLHGQIAFERSAAEEKNVLGSDGAWCYTIRGRAFPV